MSLIEASKNLGMRDNVLLQVIDQGTGKIVQRAVGHNSATDTLVSGICHYLIGDGVLNQGPYSLGRYIPKYISLGTIGLPTQEYEDVSGVQVPAFIGEGSVGSTSEAEQVSNYISHLPGFGADGTSTSLNNGRSYFGLGPQFGTEGTTLESGVELSNGSFPRVPISFRQVLSSSQSERAKTVDAIFSAMISSSTLKSMRNPENDYIFISEAGLWSSKDYISGSENGLLAGYRILPTSSEYTYDDIRKSILRVGKNQVVQVVWKIQVGSIEDLTSNEGDE